MEYKYTNFIRQNIAPKGTKQIGVYNGSKKVCNIPLGRLTPTEGKPLYSFGALSDVHIGQPEFTTALADLRRALEFFTGTEKVNFICVCGDMTYRGTDDQLGQYQDYVDTYSPNTPVYVAAGNHETYRADGSAHTEEELRTLMKTITGNDLWYSFSRGDDVFIFVSVVYSNDANCGGQPFTVEELNWLYGVLEANRNKRCFLFQHVRPDDSCGNAFGVYKTDIWNGNKSVSFENLLKHYRNVIFFHGHSHIKFELQTKDNLANYDNKYGMHSIHIPSLAAPRTGNPDGSGLTNIDAESQGYVVDVYEDGIRLRGRDFVTGEFLPIASYWLDTPLRTITPNTFYDSTGIIIT